MFLRNVCKSIVSYEANLLFVSVILFAFLIILFVMKRKLNDAKQKNEILSAQYDGVREIRHNFSNFLQALYGYIAVKDLRGIEEMCKSATKETINAVDEQIISLRKIKNPALINLITTKYELARQNCVKMHIDVKTNFFESSICMYDLCKVLGILLDNAIEAASISEEKVVDFKFIENKKCRKKIFIIENTFLSTREFDVDKIYIKGYTTKNSAVQTHGLGLWTVKKIVESNERINLKTKVNERFCQKIEIRMD